MMLKRPLRKSREEVGATLLYVPFAGFSESQ